METILSRMIDASVLHAAPVRVVTGAKRILANRRALAKDWRPDAFEQLVIDRLSTRGRM